MKQPRGAHGERLMNDTLFLEEKHEHDRDEIKQNYDIKRQAFQDFVMNDD